MGFTLLGLKLLEGKLCGGYDMRRRNTSSLKRRSLAGNTPNAAYRPYYLRKPEPKHNANPLAFMIGHIQYIAQGC